MIFLNLLYPSQPDWTFDLISVSVENHTPEKVFVELSITRPSRGIFGLSGSIDFKDDITDDFLISVSLFYSATGGSDFYRSPFNIPESRMSKFLNDFYKDMIMESFMKCGENAPETEDKFVEPLKKGIIKLKDCLISNKNMPSKMRSGYYKVIIKYRNLAEGVVEVLAKIEQNNWTKFRKEEKYIFNNFCIQEKSIILLVK